MKRTYYILTLVTLLFVFGCSSDLDESDLKGSIAGTVADATTGEPVSTVKITLSPGGKSTVTGTDGSFSFMNLDPGDYSVTLTKEGYTSATASVNVKVGSATSAHLLIERVPSVVTADREVLDFGDNSSTNTMSFNIVNRSYEDLAWTIEERCDWIVEVKPAEGVLKYGKTEGIVVVIDRDLLTAGENKSSIVIRSSKGSSQLTVTAIGAERYLPTVKTDAPTDITSNSAVLNAEILDAGKPPYIERGFVYSLNTVPSFDNMQAKLTAPVSEDPQYSYTLKGLALGETYYVRAYASNSNGTSFSTNEIKFTTVASSPQLTVQEVTNLNVAKASATLNGTVVNPGDPACFERGFVYSTNSNPTIENTKIKANGSGAGTYSANVSGLEQNRIYYVRAYAISKVRDVEQVSYSKDEVSFSFSTTLPVVTVNPVSNINVSTSSVTFNGSVTSVGDPAYYERGFVYSMSSNPTVNNTRIKANGTGAGTFSANASGMERNRDYYVRSYLISKVNGNDQVVYSKEEITFNVRTSSPSVSVQPVTNINVNKGTATFNGTVENVGDPHYTERGFVFGSSPSPTVSDNTIPVDGTSSGKFSEPVTNLNFDNTYYVRAYIKGDDKVYYSPETVNFMLGTDAPKAEMVKVTETSYSAKRAKFIGKITSAGNPSYTKRGFVYGFNSNPIVENSRTALVTGTGVNEFSINVGDLSTGQKYFVRVFTEQNGKYFYSNNELSFTLQPVATSLGQVTASDITMTTAKLLSSIKTVGDPAYTEKGFVYNSNGNPSIENNLGKLIANGQGEGEFYARLSNLTSNTTYYARAYVVQNGNVYYSTEASFKTSKQVPVVNTNSATNVMYTSATLNATITNVGEPAYNQRGFYYGTNSTPTAANSTAIIEDGKAQGDYSRNITGLIENTTYYYRGFVTQPGETTPTLGQVVSFKTGHAPNVTTGGVVNVTCSGSNESNLTWSATLYGGLSDEGNPPFTEFGFVYGTSSQPKVNDGKSTYTTTSKYEWSGNTKVFSVTVSGLSTGTHYYIRAVAKTPLGYVYGEQVEFTPAVIAPTVRTYSTECRYMDSNIGWAAAFVGVAGSLGQPAATGLGFVYGLNSNPTVGDGSSIAVTYTKIEQQNGNYVYAATASGLTPNKTYYVKTYAKTPLGYTYGEVLTFRTF